LLNEFGTFKFEARGENFSANSFHLARKSPTVEKKKYIKNMKRITPRNTVLVFILSFVLLSGGCLLAREAGFMARSMAEATAHSNDQDRVPMHKNGVLLEANLKKGDDLQVCYESYLKREPKIEEGTVEVHWMLDKRGKISSMEMVHSDLEDENFVHCLLDKIKKMTFRPPPKAQPTLVAHKFNFKRRTPASLSFKQARDEDDSKNTSEE
jgi:hypothetical protein